MLDKRAIYFDSVHLSYRHILCLSFTRVFFLGPKQVGLFCLKFLLQNIWPKNIDWAFG